MIINENIFEHLFKGVFRQFNGCPCMDPRAIGPLPGAGPPGATSMNVAPLPPNQGGPNQGGPNQGGPIQGGPIQSGPIPGGPLPFPGGFPPPGALPPPGRSAALQMAPVQFERFNRAVSLSKRE